MLGHEWIYICIMSAWVVQHDARDVYVFARLVNDGQLRLAVHVIEVVVVD